MKILIIEDEFEMLQSIERSLLAEKHLVETATDFSSAMDKVLIYKYDCILLDISLPGGSGLKILEAIKKEESETGIIVISAKNSIDDKVHGLNLGADDYLTKPFHLTELHARIRAVFRRKSLDGSDILALKNMRIDFDKHIVWIDENELKLNRKEYDILCYFAVNANRIITKEALAEHIWGDNIDSADSFDFIYSQMKNLRKKLKDFNSQVEIENIYGAGYKMTLCEE